MALSHVYDVFARTVVVLAIAIAAWAQTSHLAFADYDPPGGEPPTGRTSTSGMRL